MNLAKEVIEQDSLSLEGLEDLMDQIFGPVEDQQAWLEAEAVQADANLVTGGFGTTDGECSGGVCATLPDTKVSRHKTRRDIKHPKQEQVLLNQVKFLRARLHFALDQLEKARLTEASLRLSLAHSQDQLKELKDEATEPA